MQMIDLDYLMRNEHGFNSIKIIEHGLKLTLN